jgi:putative flippase GtrA
MPHAASRQVVKFGMVGVVNTTIDFIIYLILTRGVGMVFLAANAIAMGGAMVFSFFANKKFTFKNHDAQLAHQAFKFVCVQVGGFLIANTTLYVLVMFGMYDITAKIMASVAFTVWNFLMQKFWAFRVRSNEPIVIDVV